MAVPSGSVVLASAALALGLHEPRRAALERHAVGVDARVAVAQEALSRCSSSCSLRVRSWNPGAVGSRSGRSAAAAAGRRGSALEPDRALDRVGVHAVGVADEEGALGQEPAPALFARHLDGPELRPEDVLHAVELGEVLVEHHPVAVDQGQDTEVLGEHALEEGDGLLPHVALHEAGEAREPARVDGHLLETIEAQPLLGEGLDEAARARIVQHAVDLRLELTAQRAGAREGAQLLVGRRVPQEERQARGEDSVVGLDDHVAVGLGLRHVEKFGEQRAAVSTSWIDSSKVGNPARPAGSSRSDRCLVAHWATEGASRKVAMTSRA